MSAHPKRPAGSQFAFITEAAPDTPESAPVDLQELEAKLGELYEDLCAETRRVLPAAEKTLREIELRLARAS